MTDPVSGESKEDVERFPFMCEVCGETDVDGGPSWIGIPYCPHHGNQTLMTPLVPEQALLSERSARERADEKRDELAGVLRALSAWATRGHEVLPDELAGRVMSANAGTGESEAERERSAREEAERLYEERIDKLYLALTESNQLTRSPKEQGEIARAALEADMRRREALSATTREQG